MTSIVVEQILDCASSPAALWRVITDTERMNRAIGLGRIALVPFESDASAARYLVKTTSGGFPLEYEELPFEWVEHERWTVRRVVRRGVVRELTNTFELSPSGTGTSLRIVLSADPVWRLLAPFVRRTMLGFAKRMAREFEAIDAALVAGNPAAYDDGRAAPHADALGRAADALRLRAGTAHGPAVDALVELVASAPDAVVDRIRPYEFADARGLDRRSALSACLHGVHAGLVEMSWDLVCPSCRTAADRRVSLSELPDHARCQLCDLSFEIDLDRAVEATFHPPPNIRPTDSGPYCIGGPGRTPHVVTQALLSPGAPLTLKAPASPGRYRLFLRGGEGSSLTVDAGGAAGASLAVGGASTPPPSLHLSPGAPLVIEQIGGRARHVKIERLEWASSAATAHEVATLGEFRRLFSSQVLRSGAHVRVGRVALLFSDLTGSTQLYREAGDAEAFAVVQDHFALLDREVDRHRGTIVKTMGDAVMAAFVDEADAVRASVAMLRAFEAFRAERRGADACALKIGVHAGPCYAYTANGALDYFGQVVNVAARLQGKAMGSDVVLDAETAERAAREGWIAGAAIAERFSTELKGVGTIPAARLRLG